ncbi:ATP-binding protein [Bacillus velezensis]|uniref:ATP-binding protein n=1 Tax=Bacillus velezensis TaxID=492670 RepID=UPI001F0F11F3|nr:ATP-binding protein [Bacillus velezensis]MCV3201892.1 ATP-binding protein [Bacillus velezensis]
MLEVRIPEFFKRNSMHLLIDKVIDSDMRPMNNEMNFNFCELKYIEPPGVTILSNLLQWLHSKGVEVIFTYPSDIKDRIKKDALIYLDDSMFFKKYLGECLTERATVRPTTIEIQDVAYSDSYQWLQFQFIPWLANRLELNPVSLNDVSMCFGEIFNNIKDHAQQNIGCIFAQHYPNKHEVNITISDFGVGIPNTIRNVDRTLSDKEALEKAVQEGFSSQSTPKNRGAGLHTLIQNIVINYGGEVHIRSFRGILTCTRNNFNELCLNSLHGRNNYPGTFIEIILKTEQIENIEDDEEEFNWEDF